MTISANANKILKTVPDYLSRQDVIDYAAIIARDLDKDRIGFDHVETAISQLRAETLFHNFKEEL